MDFGSALTVLLRRWLVVLLGAAVTLGAAAYLYTSTSPTYRSTARLLLLLPSDARGADEVGSPFLYLPNGLNVLAGVVVAAPASRSFEADLLAAGLTSPYEVGVDPATPIITIGVEGPDADNVLATRDGLVAAIQTELLNVQKEEVVPERQTAHMRVFAAEDTPVRLGGNRTRAVLAVLAAGGLVTLLAAFGVDRIAEARRGRARRSAEPDPPEPDSPTPDSPTQDPPKPGSAVLDPGALDPRAPDSPVPDPRAPDSPVPGPRAPDAPEVEAHEQSIEDLPAYEKA